jgi:hypothetical protein
MKTSEVFTRAKQHLAKDYEETRNDCGKEKFICLAISTSQRKTNMSIEDAARCEHMVSSRLGFEYTLEGWLADRGCISGEFLNDHNILDRIQAHRHAWVDHMIAEFEAQGD